MQTYQHQQGNRTPSLYWTYGNAVIRMSSDHLPTAKNIIFHHPTAPRIYLLMMGAHHRENEIKKQITYIEKEIKQKIAEGKVKNALKLTADKVVEKSIGFKVIDSFNEETIAEVKKDIDCWV